MVMVIFEVWNFLRMWEWINCSPLLHESWHVCLLVSLIICGMLSYCVAKCCVFTILTILVHFWHGYGYKFMCDTKITHGHCYWFFWEVWWTLSGCYFLVPLWHCSWCLVCKIAWCSNMWLVSLIFSLVGALRSYRLFMQVLLLMATALNMPVPVSASDIPSPDRVVDALATELRTRQQCIAEITEMIHVSV